jgi:plasmid maintenance system killer protein
VIKSIRDKGLRRFFETGKGFGIQADHRKKLRSQLAALDTAATIEDMDISGFRSTRTITDAYAKSTSSWGMHSGRLSGAL